MAVYQVLKTFRDKYTNEIYEEDQEIEMTVKRAEEATKNLKRHGDFLERIDNKDPEDEAETEEIEEKEETK